MKVWDAYLVHDEPGEANVAQRDLGYYPTKRQAIRAVNDRRTAYWQTGGVVAGELEPGVPGIRPERFSSIVGQSWFIGTDGRAE